jgi:proline racemase
VAWLRNVLNDYPNGLLTACDVTRLVEAYQYDVSPAGVVTSIKIQDWNDDGKLLSSQRLALVSKIGIKLN